MVTLINSQHIGEEMTDHDAPFVSRQESRPTFNVVVPFEGVTVLQMNKAMSELLCTYILEFEDIDTEIYALAEHLRDPGSWHRKTTNAAFSVDAFGDVVTLHVNQEMLEMIRSYVDEARSEANPEDKEIRAMSFAIADPARCYELRVEKYRGNKPKKQRNPKGRHNKNDLAGKRQNQPAYV